MRNYDKKQIIHTCEGVTFAFRCHTDDMRDGYVERAALSDPFTGGQYNGKCRVWNRPWQSYEYQTACNSATNAAIAEEREALERAWKNVNGFERMTRARREAFAASDASTSSRLRALLTLRWAIGDHVPRLGLTLGYRERDILENLANVEHLESTADHELYRLTDAGGSYFVWDQITRKIVG